MIRVISSLFFGCLAVSVLGDPAKEYVYQGTDWGISDALTAGGSTANDACKTGTRQSPIDLPDYPFVTSDFSVKAQWKLSASLKVHNYGGSLKVDPVSPATNFGTLTLAYKGSALATYELLQFHFHSRSEHSINRLRSPLEVHFVHKLKSKMGDLNGATLDTYLVIGVMYDYRGSTRQSGDPLLQLLMTGGDVPKDITSTKTTSTGKTVTNTVMPSIGDLAYLVKTDRSWSENVGETKTGNVFDEFYNYRGSLTTPPCTEAVHWYVKMAAMPATAAQIDWVDKMNSLYLTQGTLGTYRFITNDPLEAPNANANLNNNIVSIAKYDNTLSSADVGIAVRRLEEDDILV